MLAGAALVALATTAAAAQQPVHLSSARGSVAAHVETDSARIAAALSSATSLAEDGHIREAMRSLRSLADSQRESGDYAGEPLRRLANLQYASGQEFEAAATLDELSDEASKFGDPAMRIRALLDAALLYQDLKLTDRVPEHARQIKVLLKSPAIDEKLRTEIASRISG
jgi:predicted negative regulator of RcsB-dependent stress response